MPVAENIQRLKLIKGGKLDTSDPLFALAAVVVIGVLMILVYNNMEKPNDAARS